MNLKQFDLTPSAKAGVFLKNVRDGQIQHEHEVFIPHRDKHYTLLIATSGSVRIMLDFEILNISGPGILLISPGQVHQLLEIDNTSGWIIDFDSSLVNETYQQVLEKSFGKPFDTPVTPSLINQVLIITGLMYQIQSDVPHTYSNKIIHELLSALLGQLAGKLSIVNTGQILPANRGSHIERTFNQLLKLEFRSWKQPAQYAQALSITVAHLNETIKKTSGIPVSLHIQQRSVLEAKRLLYLTDLSVKEIAYELGYGDPVYFSRLFKKTTALTPLQFRKKYHD